MPPECVHAQSAEDKGHCGQLQLRDGEALIAAGDALDNEPAGLQEGKDFSETVGLAPVLNITWGDFWEDAGVIEGIWRGVSDSVHHMQDAACASVNI